MVRLLDLLVLVSGLALLSSLVHWWWRPEDLFLVLLAVAAIRLVVAPVALPHWRPRRVLVIGLALYAIAYSFVTVTRHLTLRTHALDLGYYVQLTWNLARGAGPRVSLPEMHAWGDHFSPIMYLFVPAFWVVPGPVVLLVAQSVALALGALPVFGIAARRLGDERPAAVFAVLYLVNSTLHSINVRDFHAAALAIPLLLAAIYFAEAEKPWLLAAAVLLTLTTREDATLPVMGLGLWLAIARRRWFGGGAMAFGALALLLVDTRWVIPFFRGEPYPHLVRYAHLGSSVPEIVASLLRHPLRALAGIITAPRLVYLTALFAPLAFLPLLAPGLMLAALPVLLENLLGRDPVLFDYRTQYQSFVLPFLFAGAIVGYDRLARRRPGPWPRTPLAVAMLVSLAMAAGMFNSLSVERFWPKPAHRMSWEVMAQVPPGVALSAQDGYVPYLSLRPLVFVFPVGLERADYVLIHTPSLPSKKNREVTMAREDGTVTLTSTTTGRVYTYDVAAERGPTLLLRRR